jgi:murein DD-endopeptidase MepM/ murein hydrolase activator NlpD
VRTGAGTSYAIAAQLSNKTWVVVLSTSNGWSRILYNGTKTGYVSAKYLSTGTPAATALTWPVPASHSIIQYFANAGHQGIDILPSTPGAAGDTIVAAAGGTVVYSGTLSGYGYVVYINSYVNGQYIQTRYGHLSGAPWVSAGAQVSAGQAIGAMGKSGNAEGVHLHFEVRVRSSSGTCVPNSESTPVNPLNYVS